MCPKVQHRSNPADAPSRQQIKFKLGRFQFVHDGDADSPGGKAATLMVLILGGVAAFGGLGWVAKSVLGLPLPVCQGLALGGLLVVAARAFWILRRKSEPLIPSQGKALEELVPGQGKPPEKLIADECLPQILIPSQGKALEEVIRGQDKPPEKPLPDKKKRKKSSSKQKNSTGAKKGSNSRGGK
ncbi:hypothetical protein ABZS98_32300 [Streptomyces avermitilis]|uniref:hypothetical protein n=1 Tax=Streptomyces avermitilis TaxID=33903 RepID=UPI0033A753B7